MPRNKRPRPDMDIYFSVPNPMPSTSNPVIGEVIHRHTSFETQTSGLTHNRTYLTIPSMAPLGGPDSLIHNIDPGNNVADIDISAENPTSDLPALLRIEDDDDDDDSNEYPYNWMDPNFVQKHPIMKSTTADSVDEKRAKRKARLPTDTPLHHFTSQINTFLAEILRLEARYHNDSHCTRCGIGGKALYCCSDCFDTHQLCAACVVCSHERSPLHSIKEWVRTFWQKSSLKSLGLRFQLNHPTGQRCLKPMTVPNDDFVIIDVWGIHNVGLDFCDCHHVLPHSTQLLRAGLYPATTKNPRTAATFWVLEEFHMLSFMSKISGFEFYASLSHLVDNTGTSPPPYCYVAFMRMVREWRHLMLLKRSGRGHSCTGVGGTKQGECAVLCPACPQPGRNLPIGWDIAPEHKQWLYTLFLGIDANFCLKRLAVSNDVRDPGLNHGYAYIVEEQAFKLHLKEFDSRIPPEPSTTCNNYDALKSANSRGGKGLASSGAGTIDCSRHDMKRPVSVGDLQLGERYVNMDYIFLSSLRQNVPKNIVTSYDIACQWTRNLQKRCEIYETDIDSSSIRYLIPKFHLPAHQPSCHANFSFNFTPNVGRTDGEAPERGWAAMNPVANSTKEMGPGSRRDTLDDHFGDINWRKVTGLASMLNRRSLEATEERQKHVTAFIKFDASLPLESTTKWTAMVKLWECDQTQPNPFESTERRISEHTVRLELARDDASSIGQSSQVIHENMPPSLLLTQGLELEEQQRRLRIDAKALGSHSTDLQITKIIERANRLKRQIDAWSAIQLLYMPGISRLRIVDESDTLTAAVNEKLYLPSEALDHVSVPHDMMELEWRLRFAQAHDALHDIRRLILVRTQMYAAKDRFARGQSQVTRARNLALSVQGRIDVTAQKYQICRGSLLRLAQPLKKIGWDMELRALCNEDMRGLSGEENGVSEGRVSMSWMWTTHDGSGDFDPSGPRMQEALRIEWCKARARAHRWQEECLLLQEEMRRVKDFFSWEERQWVERASKVEPGFDLLLMEGKTAYAFRQAAIRAQLRTHCEVVWKEIPDKMAIGPGLPEGPDGQQYRIECH